jgi:hypothetical protein
MQCESVVKANAMRVRCESWTHERRPSNERMAGHREGKWRGSSFVYLPGLHWYTVTWTALRL